MEILLITLILALSIFALLFFWEIKRTQDRLETVQLELDQRLRAAIGQLSAESTEKLPGLEQRIDDLGKRIQALESLMASAKKQAHSPTEGGSTAPETKA